MLKFANPFTLLIAVILFSWGIAAPDFSPENLPLWLITICFTSFIVNGALAVARALTHRPALLSTVWSISWLILGSCAWVMPSSLGGEDVLEEEKTVCEALISDWKMKNHSPFVAPAAGQKSLVELAAILGKNQLLRQILELPEAKQQLPVLELAAHHATDYRRPRTLKLLLEQGVSANTAPQGTPLICLAAANGHSAVINILLEYKANPNAQDTEGNTPIIHAIINNDTDMAKQLLQNGADPNIPAHNGSNAHDYAQTDQMDALLEPLRKPTP